MALFCFYFYFSFQGKGLRLVGGRRVKQKYYMFQKFIYTNGQATEAF